MEHGIIPYLYRYNSVPAILEHYSKDLLKADDPIKRWKANRLLDYRSVISDAVFIDRIRDWFEELYDELTSCFPNVPFELIGRRKSLDSTSDKIAKLEKNLLVNEPTLVTDNPFKRVRDFLAFRITLLDNNVGDFIEESYLFADKVIEVASTKFGLQVIEHDQLLDTENFDANVHPEIFVPQASHILPAHKNLIKDYVANPKENGYQSIHILLFDPATQRYIEVQIRTLSMHIHAEIGGADHNQYRKGKYANSRGAIDFSKIHIRGFRYTVQKDSKGKKTEKIFDYAGIIYPVIIVRKQTNFAAENQYF